MRQVLFALTLSVLSIAVGWSASTALGDDVLPPASMRFTDPHSDETPDFQRHVVPLLGRLGCNSAKCHGSFQGQGGFQLSLFGFDFHSDHASIHATASSADGSRVDVARPSESLLILKPTLQQEHEGGQRFALGSWESHVLLKWIEDGGKISPNGQIETGRHLKQSSAAHRDNLDLEALAFFRESVKPMLEDHCFECHGFSQRKGGLSLTHRENLISGGASGPAINVDDPDASLLLQAIGYTNPDLQMPPSGKLSDKDVAIFKAWIREGARWPSSMDTAPEAQNQILVHLDYEPKEILFSETSQTDQVRIIARWQNGIREDVTCLTRFQTNDDAVVKVDPDGRVTSRGPGDTHVIAFYDNGVAAIPVIRPYRDPDGSERTLDPHQQEWAHPIDIRVATKLNKMGLVPSNRCTDAEFLRRVSIDMTGTLPTPQEVRRFLADTSSDKRERKIDELLQRPTYAAWWANKLCDFTGCNPKSIASLLEVAREDGFVKAMQWYDWMYDRIAANEPYDRLVQGIMLADPSGRDAGMHYFWTRQSLQEPKDTAMSVAHAFMGIQLQCAECHKHPFDRWTRGDFRDFAQFFDSVTKTKRRSSVDRSMKLNLLRSRTVSLEPGDDPRKPIMNWMRDHQNPWFAKAFVNRVWAGYFHIGIVDPPDQHTPANPPSNPSLLEWLTNGFIENGYDMKWLHRQIVSSHTYQRSWKPNATNRDDRRNFSRAIPRRMPAEVVYDALKQVTAASDEQSTVRTDLRRRASGHLSMRMAGTYAMKVFGKPDRSLNCDCERVNEPTLLQAIFTQNDPLVRMRIADSGWIYEIEEQISHGESIDQSALVDELWLRTLSRFPTKLESLTAKQRIDASRTMTDAIADLMWALLNTKEFLLNH